MVCPVCGTENPDGARFCFQCGSPLSEKPSGVGRSMEGERRIVTMLFCDVVGSTAMAERLDPEAWTEIMNEVFELLIVPIDRYEGTVARLMGDAIFAFFGAPIAHEDDPQRAVSAGLEIVEAIRSYHEKHGADRDLDLNVRVGINTGPVVVGEVGSDLRVEYTAMGLEFDRPGRRISKLEQVIELIKAHFDGSELAIGGEFVNVHGYAGRPRPVQRPHPPIIIGGGGRRVLGLAAREADIVSISNVPFVESNDAGLSPHEEARRRIGYVQAAAPERFDTLEVESSPYFTEITDDQDSALAELASKTQIPTEVLRDHPNVLIGSPATVADVLLSRRDELGVNYVTVQQPQAEAFAPVVSRLRGL